jgi:hypothetical protein
MSKQFNTRLPDETFTLINSEVERLSKETGKKISQADVVTLAVSHLVLCDAPSAEFVRKRGKKPSRREAVAAQLAAQDVTAQAVGRSDIEYGPDTELPGGEHVASMAPQRAAPTPSMDNWRAGRKPLARPNGSLEPKRK